LTLITGFSEPVNEADLVFAPGSTKVMLGLQSDLVQIVIQDAFEILLSSLLFIHAFPEGALTVQLVKDALIRAAQNHTPGALCIYQRLQYSAEYLKKVMPLVSVINVHDDSS
jgi:hypothetical protein